MFYWIRFKEHKKAEGVNRNVDATISHNECKDVLLNKVQRKDHKIRTYEISKIFLSYFDNKTYIQNNGCDGLALGYQS